jgi:calcineurin-like phosphoesterase family protein
MKTYFTADLHLQHEGVLGMSGRRFDSIEAHDDHLIGQINATVQWNDRLFLLGDVCWRQFDSYAKKIRCTNLHLVMGNHDRASFAKNVKTCQDVDLIQVQGHKIYLSHYPSAYWPASHYGSLHLYGHMHRQREATLDAAFPGRRSMDVGVDNAKHLLGEYRPFSEDEVMEILLKRPGHDDLQFYKDFQSKL